MQTAHRFYQTGGTLAPDAPSYVERKADRELFESLLAGEFCYVLDSRQMGKSSLMNRAAGRLRQAGVAVAVLDLTAIGQNLSVEQWYDGLLARLGRSLDLEDELEEYWLAHERRSPLQRWMTALQEVVLARSPGKLVIFVDEIDAVRSLPFSTDEFFAAIRECYNRRTEEPEFARLTFCLLGVATPSDLIQDTRTTPFNISRRIELTDFTVEEAAPLAAGLQREERIARMLLARVLHWTGGHAYLTQRLCEAVAADPGADNTAGVDRHCETLFLSPQAQEKDDNLLFVRERLLKSEVDRAGLLDLYAQVRGGRLVRLDNTSQLVSILRLSGLTRVDGGRLRVRNRIYEQVFDRAWIAQNMPDAELRRQRAAYRLGLARAAAISALVLAAVGGLALFAAREAGHARKQAQLAASVAEDRRRNLYAAQMSVAQQAWNQGNVGRTQELVEAQRPARGEEDLRGFEWRYLWRLCEGDIRFTLGDHQSTVTSVAYSPDGSMLASGTDDGTVKLWNATTRQLVATLGRQPGGLHAVRFSPDGRTLASGGGDGRIRLWDLASHRPRASLRAATPNVWHLAFAPDGRTLASLSYLEPAWVTVWDLPSRREIARLRSDHAFRGAAFSPDSRLLVFTNAGAVKLWDRRTKRIVASFTGPKGDTSGLAFSPDGRTVAWGDGSGTVGLWDAVAQREVARLRGPRVPIGAVVFSPDGKSLAACGDDLTIRLWDIATKQQRAVLRGHGQLMWDLAFSPDGTQLASASSDRTVKVWNVAPRREVDTFAAWSRAGYRPLAFSPDGRLLALADGKNGVRLWEIATGRALGVLARPGSETTSVAFSPIGRLLACGEATGTVTLWDLPPRRVIGELRGHPEPVAAVAFSPDGRLLASGQMDASDVRVWDIAARRILATLPHVNPNLVAFSPDGRLLAVESTNARMVRCWEVATWRPLPPLRAPSGWVRAGAFSSDGRLFASGTMEGTIYVWDVRTGQPVANVQGHISDVNSLAFSPDKKTLATSSRDGTVKLWNVAAWQEVAILSPQGSDVAALVTSIAWRGQGTLAVAFSPDGDRLTSVNSDGRAWVWRAAPFRETDAPDGIRISPSAR